MGDISLSEFEGIHFPHPHPQTQTPKMTPAQAFTEGERNWKLFRTTPRPPKQYVFNGFLAGAVGMLIAPGGTGKSFWAMQSAMAVATGFSYNPLGLINPVQEPKKVVVLNLEDTDGEVGDRQFEMVRHLTDEQYHLLSQNLRSFDLYGRDFNFMDPEWFKFAVVASKNAALTIIDTFAKSHDLDENSNRDMSVMMNRAGAFTREAAGSLLFAHHISKGSNKDGRGNEATSARGAGAIVDSARWVGFLQAAKKDEIPGVPESEIWRYIKSGTSKINSGIKPADVWLEKKHAGLLEYSKINTVDRGFCGDAGDGVDDLNKIDFPNTINQPTDDTEQKMEVGDEFIDF